MARAAPKDQAMVLLVAKARRKEGHKHTSASRCGKDGAGIYCASAAPSSSGRCCPSSAASTRTTSSRLWRRKTQTELCSLPHETRPRRSCAHLSTSKRLKLRRATTKVGAFSASGREMNPGGAHRGRALHESPVAGVEALGQWFSATRLEQKDLGLWPWSVAEQRRRHHGHRWEHWRWVTESHR